MRTRLLLLFVGLLSKNRSPIHFFRGPIPTNSGPIICAKRLTCSNDDEEIAQPEQEQQQEQKQEASGEQLEDTRGVILPVSDVDESVTAFCNQMLGDGILGCSTLLVETSHTGGTISYSKVQKFRNSEVQNFSDNNI